MKRRDLLKQTAALALGLPALRAGGAGFSPAQSAKTTDLMVTLTGPFCYWLDAKGIRVMAPPVGKDFHFPKARHQAWVATHANETTLNSVTATDPEYRLNVPNPSGQFPDPQGTKLFRYGQDKPMGKNPLFNLYLPFPNTVVGVRPTSVCIIEKNATEPQPYELYAAGLTLVYKNVELERVDLTSNGQSLFKPCFKNDEFLPVASLGFFLTQIDQGSDSGHRHAHEVWSAMLTMYPWMEKDIKCINFDPSFDPKKCEHELPPPTKICQKPGLPAVGPGNDCEVPGMLLTTGGPMGAQPKK